MTMERGTTTTNRPTACRSSHKGFTLAEATVALVIVGAAAAGVLLPYGSGAAVRAEGLRRTLAAKLASDLIEQIVNTPFVDVVDEFNYAESEGQIKDASGTPFSDPAYAKLSRDVTCQYVYVPQQSGARQPNFILVTARVYYGGKQIVSINRLISE